MLAKILYNNGKRTGKYSTFCIPIEDIWNGEYRRQFEKYYRLYGNEYRVNQNFAYGLFVEFPVDERGEPELPVITFETPKTATKAKEVFEKCAPMKQAN